MLARAFVNEAALVSTSHVLNPELANACAIPVPIRPAPTTTTFSLLAFMFGSRLGAVLFTDHIAQRANALDAGLDYIAFLEEQTGAHPHSGWRTGE
ncbi:hypothetical protein D3C85_1704550 [compost metagenome]